MSIQRKIKKGKERKKEERRERGKERVRQREGGGREGRKGEINGWSKFRDKRSK